jgi:hypothetical protein
VFRDEFMKIHCVMLSKKWSINQSQVYPTPLSSSVRCNLDPVTCQRGRQHRGKCPVSAVTFYRAKVLLEIPLTFTNKKHVSMHLVDGFCIGDCRTSAQTQYQRLYSGFRFSRQTTVTSLLNNVLLITV